MKAILDLSKAINNSKYFDGQFNEKGKEKNILFVAPQLSTEHLYNYILPFFSFFNEDVFPAITSLEKFKPYEQIVRLDVELNAKELRWANFVVFPFTTQDLSKEFGLYEAIREVNPTVQIVFYVDFNFFEIPKKHHYYELFQFPDILDQLEKNILRCDLCLTTNEELDNYMYDKFNKLVEEKYQEDESVFVNFSYIPSLIDEEIVTQNIDFDTEKPKAVIKRKTTIKVAKVAETIKNKDLKANKTKAKALKKKPKAPKKVTTKAIKVNAKDDKGVEDSKKKTKKAAAKTAKGSKKEGKGKEDEVSKEVVWDDKTNSPEIVDKPAVPVETEIVPVKLDRPYKMGVIVTDNNFQEVLAFKDEFLKINQKYPDVSIVMYGYDYKGDKKKQFRGMTFEYVPPVSIMHYFKQLKSLELDFVVIPLVKNIFNITSEKLHRYFECAIFDIPIIAPDFFPYTKYITDHRNGYLYKNKSDLLGTMGKMFSNPELITHMGLKAKDDVVKNHSYTETNVSIMSDVYDEKQQENDE